MHLLGERTSQQELFGTQISQISTDQEGEGEVRPGVMIAGLPSESVLICEICVHILDIVPNS
jgi:hypothetical protein